MIRENVFELRENVYTQVMHAPPGSALLHAVTYTHSLL